MTKKEGKADFGLPLFLWERAALLDLERQVKSHLEEAGASDGVLDEAEFAGWGADVGVGSGAVGLAVDWERRTVLRRIFEERVELDVVVGRVEARVVEDVERLHVELEVESFVDLEVFEYSHVNARLERADENIAASGTKVGLVDVANGFAARSVARWDAVLPGLQQRNAECRAVEDRITGIDAERALQNRIRALRAAGAADGNERVGDEVVAAAVELAGDTTAELDDAVGLAAFRGDQAASAPTVDDLVGPTVNHGQLREFVGVRNHENVATVEVGVSVAGAQVFRIIAVVKELLAAFLVHAMRPGIRARKRKAVAVALGDVELQRVVVGFAGGFGVLRVGVEADERDTDGGVAAREALDQCRDVFGSDSGDVVAVGVDLTVDRARRRGDVGLVERNRDNFVDAVITDEGE